VSSYLVKYGNLKYYKNLPSIEEIGYPFQTFGKFKNKYPILPYSLHTEYSASVLNNETIKKLEEHGFKTLSSALKSKKADLWSSRKWIEEFIDFIDYIIKYKLNNKIPKIIEIHPPYIKDRNYDKTLDDFFENYRFFEEQIKKKYSNELIILIENRNTSGNFLLSKSSDYLKFKDKIIKEKLDLKLIVDIPQLYGKMLKTFSKYTKYDIIENIFVDLNKSADVISGFHVCGKGHKGDFNDLFGEHKEQFLSNLRILVKNIPNDIYVVPEINGQKNFESIMSDLVNFQIFDFN